MKPSSLALIVAAALAAGGTAYAQDKADAKKSGAKPVVVRLSPLSKSGERGTARLTPEGDKTKVELSLSGGPKGTAQPAHIHEGSCAKLDPKPKYGLENVVDGKSTTEVPVSIETLTAGGLAVNVHKSGQDIKTYVACGNIKKSGGGKM
jgi:hypothetical protein